MAITSSSPPRPPAGQPATSTRRASPDSRSVPRMTSSSSMRRLQIGQRCAMRMRSSALGSPRLSAGIHETSTETGSSFVWHLRGSRRIAATTNSKAEMSCRSAVGWPDRRPRGPCGLSGRTRGAAGRHSGNRVVLQSRRPSDRRALRAGNSVPARVGQQTVHGCRHHVAGETRRAVGDRSHRPLDQTDAALVERHYGGVEPEREITAFRSRELLFPPGSRWRYSSPGYVLLAHIIERASGEAYATLLTERVLRHAHLDDTFVGNAHGR